MLHILIVVIVTWVVLTNLTLLFGAFAELKRFKNKEVSYLISRRRLGISALVGVNEVTYLDNGVVVYIAPNGLKVATHLNNVTIYSHEK